MKLKRYAAWLLLLVLAFAAPALAQEPRTPATDEPLEGTLDTDSVAQVYTFAGGAGDAVVLTVTNEAGVPLVLLITNALGETVAQAIDDDVDGELVLEGELEVDGTYYVTVFKAGGVNSVREVEFTLVLEGAAQPVDVEATPEATVAPTVEATEAAVAVTPEATAALTPAVADPGQVLTTSGATISLTWSANADMDLEVRDPVGGTVFFSSPTSASGGSYTANVNQACANVVTENATETIQWAAGGIPTGSYEVLVYYQQACAGDAPVEFTVNTTVEGATLPPVQGSLLPGQVYVSSFNVAPDASAQRNANAGVVDLEELPAPVSEMIAVAQPITFDAPTTGTLTNQQPYLAYSFTTDSVTLLTIAMSGISGSLDTYLGLLDANGNLVAFNDDQGDGITDSLISGALLPDAGTYTIVASRYGKQNGGTEGDFTLSLTTQAANLTEEFINLPAGALEIRLLWNTAADLQLLVRDPAGDNVFDDSPQIPSGGTLGASGNVGCRVSTGTPFSYVYWDVARPPRPGTYEVEVWYQADCADTTPVSFNLYVELNQQQVYQQTVQPIPGERFLTSFTIEADGRFTPSDGGIIRGLETLDYQSELTTAIEVAAGVPVNGSITQANKFDVYAFDAAAGDTVSVAMTNTSGILDTTLYLVGPSGALVAENDDITPGENTNSLIADLTLPEAGRYIIIATHYGARYGGTTGTYSLTLTESN